jgi:hypothetical protein
MEGRPLVVANVYAPVNPGRRQDWFKATAVSLVERPLVKECDIVGRGDWNEIVTASDHHRHRAPVESRAEMMKLINRLGGENQAAGGRLERNAPGLNGAHVLQRKSRAIQD